MGVANGDRVACDGVCTAVSVRIGDEHFFIDLFAIPLGGYEILLGCHWLCTLGPDLCDLDRLSMSFWRDDRCVHWVGLDTTAGTHARAATSDDLLPLLLSEFHDIFAEPQGLPPPHASDHRIHLLPATPPVAVRPYRYPQLLKDEIE